MQTCPSCNRHLIHTEATCPFCGAATESALARSLRRMGTAVMVTVTPLVLAACYGPPMSKDSETAAPDLDGDGVTATTDCDDNNAAVFPGATEICDDTIDNNCDNLIDAADTTACP